MAEDLGAVKWRIVADTSDLDRAEERMDRTGRTARDTEKKVDRMGREIETAGRRSKKATDDVHRGFMSVSQAVRIATGALTALGASIGIREVIQYADEWRNAENQLRQVTTSSRDLAKTQKDLVAISKDTRSNFSATTTLYARLVQSTKEMNVSQAELLNLTGAINKSFVIYGASAQETEGAIRQLAQGLAAGALRGDEFNSVAEQAPAIMDAIADHLKMTRGELRDFAAEGGITAEIVVEAMQKASDTIDEQFSKTLTTFGQSAEIAKTNALEFVGTSEQLQSISTAAGQALVTLSENLDEAGAVAATVAVVVGARLVPAVVGLAAAISPATTAVIAITTAVSALVVAFRNLDEAQDRAVANVVSSWSKLETDLSIRQWLGDLKKLTDELDAMPKDALSQSSSALRNERLRLEAEIQALVEKIATASQHRVSIQEELVDSTGEVADEEERWKQLLKDLQDESSDLYKGIQKVTKAQKEQGEAVSDLVKNLRFQIDTVNASAREQAILNTMLQVGEGATLQYRMAVMALAGVLYDQQEAQRRAQEQTESAAEAIAKANKEAAEQSAEDWREFRDDVSDYFADVLENGESVADSLAKTFRHMIYQIAGDLVASGIRELLAPGSGGFSVASALSNAGTGGKITQALLSSLGPSAGSVFGSGLSNLGLPGQELAGPTMDGSTLTKGFDFKQLGMNLAAGAAGSFAGNKLGQGIFDKQAESSIGATIGGTVGGAVGGPLGAFIGSTIGAMVDVAAGGDGMVRSNAGFLVGPTPGAKPEYTFSTAAFASGLNPTGLARREDQQKAEEVIDLFRNIDKNIVDMVNELGGNLSVTSLRGLDEEANPGSLGTFLGLGVGGESLAAQLNSFVDQLADNVTGLDDALLEAIRSASTADQVITLLTQAVAEQTAAEEEKAQAVKESTAAQEQSVAALSSALDMALHNVRLIQDALNTAEPVGNEITGQINAILEQRQGLIDAYREEVSAAEAVHNQKMRQYEQELRLAQQIENARFGILTGNNSSLSSQGRLDTAMARFFDLSQRAVNGDVDAGNQIGQAANVAAQLARDMFASSSRGDQIVNSITERLAAVQSQLGTSAPGDFVAPSDAALQAGLANLDSQLAALHDSIAVDTIDQLAALNLKLADLPEDMANAIRSLFTDGLDESLQIGTNFDILRNDIVTALGLLPQATQLTSQGIAAHIEALTNLSQHPQILAGSFSQAVGTVLQGMVNAGYAATSVADAVAQIPSLVSAANTYLANNGYTTPAGNPATIADFEGSQNPSYSAAEIVAYAQNLLNSNDPNTAYTHIINSAIGAGIGSTQLANAWNQITGDSLSSQEINLIARDLGLPEFAQGGYTPGGLALVGERGPEIVNFDRPAQIYSNSDFAGMMDQSAVVVELRAVREELAEMKRILFADASHSDQQMQRQTQVLESIESNTQRRDKVIGSQNVKRA